MSAQAVFDCDDLKKEIFSYCLPQYPIVTAEMIKRRAFKWAKLDIDRIQRMGKKGAKYLIRNLKQRTKVMPLWKADWILTMDTINEKKITYDIKWMYYLADRVYYIDDSDEDFV